MHRNNPKGRMIYFNNAQIIFPAASAILHNTPNNPMVAKARKRIAIMFISLP